MALNIENTLENGVPTNYHRIISINANFKMNQLVVQIASYVGENQRKAELAIEKDIKDIFDLRSKISDLLADPTEENEEERKALSEKVNSFIEEKGEPLEKDFSVSTEYITLDIENEKLEDISRESIYKLLKKKGYKYAGATKA